MSSVEVGDLVVVQELSGLFRAGVITVLGWNGYPAKWRPAGQTAAVEKEPSSSWYRVPKDKVDVRAALRATANMLADIDDIRAAIRPHYFPPGLW
ncbi:hypothetical protein [Actinoallomurus sp. NPDC052274]|uniref:hypothetical protein n=1 Tax=Actinoallomurus sp. NPDC052274 TaxID=3155420 RepID=UPI0034315FB2